MTTTEVSSRYAIETVLFATDFSPASLNAGRYAASISHRFSAKLAVAHAFTPSEAVMEVELGTRLSSQHRKDLNRHLAKIAETLAGPDGSSSLLLEGDPIDVIPDRIEKERPGLLVLGTHGRNALERRMLGSTAAGILRRSSWPVLTVGPHVPSLPGALNISHILFATDSSVDGACAAPITLSFVEAFGSSVEILNIIHERDREDPDRMKDLTRKFHEALDRVAPQNATDFSHPRTFVARGDAHRRILSHIEERPAELLILGIRRDGHLGMTIKTSGAFKLISEAKCPVLTVTDGCRR